MIEWVEKTIKTGCLGTVKLVKTKGNQSNIHFYENSINLITKEKYVVFGVEGTRLYFKGTSSNKGYKTSCYRSCGSTCSIRFPTSKLNLTEKEEGDYHLEWDKDLQLYYIDITHKINPEKALKIQFIGK